MSIYATHWSLKFPATGDYYHGCDWVEVIGQAVPGHIGSPTPGCGYEDGDPYADFLPPPVEVDENEDGPIRAMVVVRDGAPKVGQRYVEPLLVLSGQEYHRLSFAELHALICDALRSDGPWCVGQWFAGGKTVLFFADGSIRERPISPEPG